MDSSGLFTLFDGGSPWWWVAFAVALGVVEMLTFSYYLIWVALAALATGGASALIPALPIAAQLGLFAGLSVAFTMAGRHVLRRHRRGRPASNPGLNRRSERVIGRTGRSLGAFEHREGLVEIDGVRWSARLAGAESEAAEGRSLKVVAADGMVLICEPV